MAFKDLFKTKAERRAYAIGRKHQYDKEHPLMHYAVEAIHYSFDEKGKPYGRPYTMVSSSHKSATEAQKACRRANEMQRFRKQRVLEAVKKKKVNIHNSVDCTYTDYRVVKKKSRQ